MLRPGARLRVLGSRPGAAVGVVGGPVPVPDSTADWTASCAQQAHTRCRLGSVAAELCVGVSEAWDAAAGSDVAERWAVSVAEALTRRPVALLEEPSKPCSSRGSG